ncbi:hypothetical protein H4582DRAFT_372243 [Lactarius indigo]|nr:hypothetical protein H4582DRAFT_372243 [Lactarius indigo]
MSTMLSRMPELQCLTLRNVFLVGTRADGMLNGCISLPNLRQMSLIDQQGYDLFSFAASLSLPPETCAEIKTNGGVWLDTLLPQYERTFGPVRRLKLLVNGYPQISLEFRASEALTVERSSPAQLRLAYSLLPPPLPHAAESPSSRIAHHFGAARLRLEGLLYLDIREPRPVAGRLLAHAIRARDATAAGPRHVSRGGRRTHTICVPCRRRGVAIVAESLLREALPRRLGRGRRRGRPASSARGFARGRPRATPRHPRKRNTRT